MDRQKTLRTRDRFLKLSLRKNRLKKDEEAKKLNRSSDCIIIDESFERFRSDFPPKVQSSPKIIYSPIVINDSDMSDDLPLIVLDKEPSKTGNVSFNCSKDNKSPLNQSKPSIGGWSPAQSIICATPKQLTIPSTPKDVANESLEECSIKKIQQSQKKLLDDLYGQSWKSIPTLFKTLKHKYDNIEGISKKLQFNDDESDKENIRKDLQKNKKLYLDATENRSRLQNDMLEKSKKKLYTEKIPSTPDVPKQKSVRTRNANTTSKKKKVMSVTELVQSLNDIESLTKKVENASVKNTVEVLKTPVDNVKRLSFIGSLADNVPSWRCHPDAAPYHSRYKALREQLCRRLYAEFNTKVFEDQLDADMIISWDSKLRSTAGTTTNRLIRTAAGVRVRSSSIKLSSKVVDGPQRLRDTLIHELCHAATWLLDGELRAGHGPLWKKWAHRSLLVFPELGEIARCHDMQIHFKYTYKCNKCGYSVQRHSKSIDVTKKCCGYCRGTFEVIVNRKNKDGVIVSTPARKAGPNDFALYVKEHYSSVKSDKNTHAQVMKILGEQFSARKNNTNT